jgi:hypothetical protein
LCLYPPNPCRIGSRSFNLFPSLAYGLSSHGGTLSAASVRKVRWNGDVSENGCGVVWCGVVWSGEVWYGGGRKRDIEREGERG